MQRSLILTLKEQPRHGVDGERMFRPSCSLLRQQILRKCWTGAREAGADIAFIDTPPLAQADATIAAKAADLVLIPCRPRAFDLHAIRLTASLMQMTGKPAFAMFNGGHPSATASYAEPEEVVAAIGLKIAPFRLADRAPYHQAVMTGQAAQENRAIRPCRSRDNGSMGVVVQTDSHKNTKAPPGDRG